jgi:hypothetical protein
MFTHYGIDREALQLLHLAQQSDAYLYDHGDFFDKLWPGRLVTFNNFAFVF